MQDNLKYHEKTARKQLCILAVRVHPHNSDSCCQPLFSHDNPATNICMKIRDNRPRIATSPANAREIYRIALRSGLCLFACYFAITSISEGDENNSLPKKFPNTQAKQQTPDPPDKSLARMSLPRGFHATLFAGEPDVTQPISMTIDDRGRLWVAQCFTSPDWVTTATGPDRILIFTDTNQDGHFDSKHVFADNLPNLTSIEVGLGGVWACCAPNLIFIPDRDRDDRPDGPAEILLDGWTTPEHNVFNGLTWGPDGWLYGCHGILGSSFVGSPGTPKSQRQEINCGIWRFHPREKRFEIVCHGTTNPWGLDFDERGQGFFTNCVIGHLWQMIPGARFKRMFGEHLNPHLYQLIDSCADHRHWHGGDWTSSRFGITHDSAGGGHAHAGCMIYLGDNWPDTYRQSVYTCNIHGNRVNRDLLKRKGSGYVGSRADDFMLANSPWFRGLELIYGPDGGVFISDWTDYGECHDNDGVHRSSGRIYKVIHEPIRRIPSDFDLAEETNEQLVSRQSHHNAWYARRARLQLQQRSIESPTSTTSLQEELVAKIANHQLDDLFRLRYLWTLHVTGLDNEDLLASLLDDRSVDLRVWAIRLLTERNSISTSTKVKLTELAREEPSPFVRLELASALQRLPETIGWKIGEALLTEHDVADETLTLMTWYGIEPLVCRSPGRALRLAASSRDGQVSEFVMRRLGGSPATEFWATKIISTLTASPNTKRQIHLLRGLQQGIRTRDSQQLALRWPPSSADLYTHTDRELGRLALMTGLALGDSTARKQLQELARNPNAKKHHRQTAISTLSEEAHYDLAFLLLDLLEDKEVRVFALRGLSNTKQGNVAQEILSRYRSYNADERQAAINTMASRPQWAFALLDAISRKKIPPSDVTNFQIRQMKLMKQQTINALIARIWPVTRSSSADQQQQIARYKSILGNDFLKLGSAGEGRAVFKKRCANCHRLFDDGGDLGPELTGSGRKNLDYILQNIVDPSATLASSYRMTILETADGNVLSGVAIDRGNGAIELRTPERSQVFQKSQIESLTPSQQSPMPDGLLDSLSEKQLRDLICYLYSDKQVAMPAVPTRPAETP